MTARRLKRSEHATVRAQLLEKQGGRCAICKLPLTAAQAVLDHDHSTGAVRAALHRGCNSLLGKLENNAPRYGVRDLQSFANGVAPYLRTHAVNVTGLLYADFRTEDERRVARNTKARKAYAAGKASKDQDE